MPTQKQHSEYWKNFGEMQTKRNVARLVDGVEGKANHDNNDDMVYLLILMGYLNCSVVHGFTWLPSPVQTKRKSVV